MPYRNFNDSRKKKHEEPLVFDFGESRIKTKSRIPFVTLMELLDIMESMESGEVEQGREMEAFKSIIGLFRDLIGEEGFQVLMKEDPDLDDLVAIASWIMEHAVGSSNEDPTTKAREVTPLPTSEGSGASSKQTSGAFTFGAPTTLTG